MSSPLPSREGVAIDLALAEVDLSDAPLRDILTIAAEWASGRLVDREAIDWSAMLDVFNQAIVTSTPWSLEEFRPIAEAMIAAALGEE